jgi:hypothetical protein
MQMIAVNVIRTGNLRKCRSTNDRASMALALAGREPLFFVCRFDDTVFCLLTSIVG